MNVEATICRKIQGHAEPGNSCLQTAGTCESCPEWAKSARPKTWDEYRRDVIEFAEINGFIEAAKYTGIGKTTLYRWRKELK